MKAINFMIRSLLVCVCILFAGCASNPGHSGFYDKKSLSDLNKEAYSAFENAMLERAEPMYREIVSRQPENADAFFMLGNIYLRMGHLDAAVSHYRTSIEIDPNQSRTWYNLYLATIQQAIGVLENGMSRVSDKDMHYGPMEDQLRKLYGLHQKQ